MIVAGAGQIAYPLVTRSSANVLVVVGGLRMSGGTMVYNIQPGQSSPGACPLPLQGRMNASVLERV